MAETDPTEKPKFQMLVLPNEVPAAPPYANTTYTFTYSPTDVTILFLRAPLLNDEQILKLVQEGSAGVVKAGGAVVSAVTLPRPIALSMAHKLVELLSGEPK